METKQQKQGTAPRWAVRLKRELKETRKEYALETSRKQAADLFIVQMGLWDNFKKWMAENTELKNDPEPSIFDKMHRIACECNYWKGECKKGDEKVEFWQKDSEWWREEAVDIIGHCKFWIEEYNKLREKIDNQEANKNN